MIGRTIDRYFAALFLKWILGLFLGVTLLTLLIDFLEVVRSNASREDADVLILLAISATRVPLITEQLLPFAVLVGSIGAFLSLSRRSELVVSRAAGLSVWQFSRPGLLVAVAVGILATVAYNPLATALKAESDRLTASLGTAASILTDTSSGAWLRQQTPAGEAVIRVQGIGDSGRLVLDPVFWVFGEDGLLKERVEAVMGEIEGDEWMLSEARIVDASGAPERRDVYRIPTSLTPEQIRNRLSSPEIVSFWHLPETISQAAASGLPPYRFRLQFHVLLARPLLLASMVLIAATVSLGLARSGGVGRMILGGVGAGFMLYVATEIARDLGSEGLVPAALAAWAPAVVATLLGSTVLLYREDG